MYGNWDALDGMRWDDIDFSWYFPYRVNDVTWDDMRTATYESLNRATFAGEYYDSDDIDERMVVNVFSRRSADDIQPSWNGIYFWDNLYDMNWLDVEHLDWDSTVIGGDIRTHFVIGGFDASGNRDWGGNTNIILELVSQEGGYGRFVFPENDTNEPDVVYFTNLLNESPNTMIKEFEYHYVSPFSDIDLGERGYEIIAIARHMDVHLQDVAVNLFVNSATQSGGEWHLYHPSDATLSGIVRRWCGERIYNPTWIDTTYMNSYTVVPKNTDINLNYSVSRINGKCCPQWEVRNLDNQNTPVMTSTHKNFHHLFRDTGRYNVKLVLRDTNGNVYTSDRCMFEVV